MVRIAIRKYATALLNIAVDEHAEEEYAQEAEYILEAFKKAPELMDILVNQRMDKDSKLTLIKSIFVGNFSKAIVGLVTVAVEKGREGILPEIFERFIIMIKEKKSILRATVTSAVDLNQEQIDKIKKSLENSTKCQIELSTVVDQSIIAGLVVKVGDKIADASIKGEIESLKRKLTESGFA